MPGGVEFECKVWIDEDGDEAGDCAVVVEGEGRFAQQMENGEGSWDEDEDEREGGRGRKGRGRGRKEDRGGFLDGEGSKIVIDMGESKIIMISAATKIATAAAALVSVAITLY